MVVVSSSCNVERDTAALPSLMSLVKVCVWTNDILNSSTVVRGTFNYKWKGEGFEFEFELGLDSR